MEKQPIEGIHWLSDDDYRKAVGQLRLHLNGVFTPFTGYGHDVFIPMAISECVKLAEDFGLRVRGVDKPISLKRDWLYEGELIDD